MPHRKTKSNRMGTNRVKIEGSALLCSKISSRTTTMVGWEVEEEETVMEVGVGGVQGTAATARTVKVTTTSRAVGSGVSLERAVSPSCCTSGWMQSAAGASDGWHPSWHQISMHFSRYVTVVSSSSSTLTSHPAVVPSSIRQLSSSSLPFSSSLSLSLPPPPSSSPSPSSPPRGSSAASGWRSETQQGVRMREGGRKRAEVEGRGRRQRRLRQAVLLPGAQGCTSC